MPLPRPATAIRAATSLTPYYLSASSSSSSASRVTAAAAARRSFSTTEIRKGGAGGAGGGAHEEQYDPPTGWLWGIKPGEKVEKEGWETLWIVGVWGSLALGVVGYAFKPDTSIQTWALEEARRRLEAEGILEEPEDES